MPAAAPGLVADASELGVGGLIGAVCAAEIGEARAGRMIAVFHPVAQLARRARANVAGDVRLCPDGAAELNKFVGAEVICFNHAAPMQIHAPRPTLARADAIGPVIIVGKTSPRPAQDRRL